jgi:hypothetical protein
MTGVSEDAVFEGDSQRPLQSLAVGAQANFYVFSLAIEHHIPPLLYRKVIGVGMKKYWHLFPLRSIKTESRKPRNREEANASVSESNAFEKVKEETTRRGGSFAHLQEFALSEDIHNLFLLNTLLVK